jgi:hypothetical protein
MPVKSSKKFVFRLSRPARIQDCPKAKGGYRSRPIQELAFGRRFDETKFLQVRLQGSKMNSLL